MLISLHTDGMFTIKADRKDMELLRICCMSQILKSDEENIDKDVPSYRDAVVLKDCIDRILSRSNNRKNAQN